MAAIESSSAQTPDPDFPNLPLRQSRVFDDANTLTSSTASNVAFVGPSAQWIQIVNFKVTADVLFVSTAQAERCRVLFGDNSPRCVIDRPGALNKNALRGLGYPNNFVGNDVASPPAPRSELRRFGAEFTDFPTQQVRLLAFGSVPVEATLHLSLATDDRGLPYGIQLDADNYIYPALVQEVTDTSGSADIVIRLSDVRADGVPVEVGNSCQLSQPAALKVEGRGYDGSLAQVPPGRYNPQFGGLLQGTLSVGSFEGCGSIGEDLDPLIDAMAGNSEVPVQIVQATTNVFCFGDSLIRAIDESRCNLAGKIELPEGSEPPPLPPSFLPPPPVD